MEDIKEQSAQTTEPVDNNTEVGASEIADTSKENEMEFTNTDNENGEDKAQTTKDADSKPKENSEEKAKSQKTNADYARERRRAEQKKALEKARYDAIIEALDGENPYTHEKMEDGADVEEYLTMKEIEKQGKDPITDYHKFLKDKAKEKEKAQREASSQEEWISKDRDDFISKHPDVKLDELLQDDLFRTFALGKAGKMPMDKIYADFQSFIEKSEERARDRAAQLLANNAATPGKLSSQAPQPAKSVKDMSKAEFEQMVERVKRGEKI